ncbi:MAG: YkgJ family cysteine cluster protein [Verrucomicrobia bacterium]|nr:YkgJ family cysteine cluster protein [Verrucomicrobiota bacterium]
MALPWYKEGLRFACTGCGKCCTGAPGVVWVSEEEISQIAQHLQVEVEKFRKRYVRVVEGRLSLKEYPVTWDCIFLKEGKKCSIYEVRPKQCRTYPWWASNLESPEAWKRAAAECEGIRSDGPLFTKEEIERECTSRSGCNDESKC